jgi:hypothetical protein
MRTLPRYEIPSPGRHRDALVRPVPPSVVEALAGDEVAQRHLALAERYGEKRTKVVASAAALEKAAAQDTAEQRAALEAGREPKPARAAKAEEELGRLRRELEVLAELLDESAEALLGRCLPVLSDVDARLGEQVERELDEAAAHIAAALRCFEGANRLAGEQGWVARLVADGTVAPWGGRPLRASREAEALAGQALQAIADERERRRQRVEEAAAEREAGDVVVVHGQAQPLQPVPGQQIWKLGETIEPAKAG